MATITGSCDNSRYVLTCEWTSAQNISSNQSTITAIVYLSGNGYTTTSSHWSCVINGVTVTSNKSASIGGKTELGRRTWTVNHDSNGSCTASISFSYNNGLSSSGTYTTKTGSGSGEAILPTIPRASSFTLNKSSVNFGENITLTINRASSNFKHTIKYRFGSINTILVGNVDTSYTFAAALSDAIQIPNATSGTATIIVETVSSGNVIGSASRTITLKVPSSVVPTVGISVVANNTLDGTNIEGKTTFTVKPTNAKGSQGSTIKSYSITGEGLSTTSSNGGTSKTVSSGEHKYTVKVTDSRGRTATATKTVTVYPYSSPTFSYVPYRANKDGVPLDEGEYVYANLTYAISNPNDRNRNTRKVRLSKKTFNATDWAVIQDWQDLPNYQGAIKVAFGGGFLPTTSYSVRIEIKDNYNQVVLAHNVGTLSAILNLEKEGVGIGKIHENGALDVGGDLYVQDNIYLYNTSGKITGLCIKNGSSDIWGIRQATHEGVDVGDSKKHTAICSVDTPTWWNGSNSFEMWSNQSCTVVSGGSGGTSYRFHNGMQINTMQIYGTWNITTAWGSVYSSPHITPSNYVQAFLSPPQVSITAHGAGTAVMVCQAGAPTTTMPGTYYLWKPVQQTGVKDYIEIISIGRWK